jgi:hypothetical protein
MFIPDPGPDFFSFIPDPQHWIFHSLDVVSPWMMELSPMRPDHIYRPKESKKIKESNQGRIGQRQIAWLSRTKKNTSLPLALHCHLPFIFSRVIERKV